MSNDNLKQAKKTKNDEFYTQWADIEKEVMAYIDYNPDVFRDKTILLPCDDPEWSNFTKFFAQNFEVFGLKKLISTSYAYNSKKVNIPYQTSLFEKQAPHFNPDINKIRGKIFTLEHDTNQNGVIDIEDLEWRYLEGDGDFRSDEVKKLRDEADIIITNPPFSIFREFFTWITDANKEFIIIGSINSLNFDVLFSMIKNNKVWLGNGFSKGNAFFAVPENTNNQYAEGVYNAETGLVKFRNCCWFTNIEHGRRHQQLQLMSLADNIKYSKHKDIKGRGYNKYYNYNAIDVPYTDAIPNDFNGIMGVPISFLDKYCPEQFEIIGKGSDVEKTMLHTVVGNEIHFIKDGITVWKTPYTVSERKAGNSLRIDSNGVPGNIPYARILIRRKINYEN